MSKLKSWDDVDPIMLKIWGKELAEEALGLRYFAQFMPRSPLTPLTLRKRVHRFISGKWGDILVGCRIIFRGEYPEEDY